MLKLILYKINKIYFEKFPPECFGPALKNKTLFGIPSSFHSSFNRVFFSRKSFIFIVNEFLHKLYFLWHSLILQLSQVPPKDSKEKSSQPKTSTKFKPNGRGFAQRKISLEILCYNCSRLLFCVMISHF